MIGIASDASVPAFLEGALVALEQFLGEQGVGEQTPGQVFVAEQALETRRHPRQALDGGTQRGEAVNELGLAFGGGEVGGEGRHRSSVGIGLPAWVTARSEQLEGAATRSSPLGLIEVNPLAGDQRERKLDLDVLAGADSRLELGQERAFGTCLHGSSIFR